VETGAGEDLGSFHFSECRTQNLETPHEVRDEIGKPVHRFGQADERIRAFLIETPHPGRDRERGHQEDSGGLGKRPTPSGAKFEGRQSLRGRIMGSSVGLELLHAGILDADLFSQELDLLLQPITLGPPSELMVHALRGQPWASAMEVRAREMTWMTAERTRRGQPRGKGREWNRAIGDMSGLPEKC